MSRLAIMTGLCVVALGALTKLGPRAVTPSRRDAPNRLTLPGKPGSFAALGGVRRLCRSHEAKRQPDPLELADALERMARLVRSGSSIASALTDVAGAHPGSVLDAIDRRRRAGIPLPAAVADLAAGAHEPTSTVNTPAGARQAAGAQADRRLALAVLGAVLDGGGSSANAIDQTAATIRERAAVRADRHAHAAQARLSARIMSALPIGFTSWAILTDDRTARFVLRTPAGLVCLGTGIGLDVLGWRWMRRIVRVP